jgi:hypothetical protein
MNPELLTLRNKQVGETVIRELEKSIKVICKAIRRDKDCTPETMTALARLVNSLSNQEDLRVDPMETGRPGFYESLGAD